MGTFIGRPINCLAIHAHDWTACIGLQVSNTEAVNLLRQVLAMRNKSGKEAAELQQGQESTSEAMEESASTSSSPVAELPSTLTPDLAPAAELAAPDPTIESTEANTTTGGRGFPLRSDPEPVQIQAGCTAVVAVFQVTRISLYVKCTFCFLLLANFGLQAISCVSFREEVSVDRKLAFPGICKYAMQPASTVYGGIHTLADKSGSMH